MNKISAEGEAARSGHPKCGMKLKAQKASRVSIFFLLETTGIAGRALCVPGTMRLGWLQVIVVLYEISKTPLNLQLASATSAAC